MIGEKLGHVFDRPLRGLAGLITLSPNSLTVTGFLLSLAASIILARDIFFGAVLILVSGAFDILDGVVARRNNKVTPFGAFLDSVLDRYSDAAMYLGLSVNLLNQQNTTGAFLSVIALIGSLLISYTRARAEGLGWSCSIGLMERPERIIVLSLGALGGFIMPALWLLATLTHLTAAQRVHHIWRLASNERSGG